MYQKAAACHTCPLKATCTPGAGGRKVSRSFHEAYLERVRGYHETEAYRKAMRKRKVGPEPLIGEAKQWHGLRQFRLRGLANVDMEGLLIAAGQNLERWLAATGWGRRHGPSGSLAAVAPANWQREPRGCRSGQLAWCEHHVNGPPRLGWCSPRKAGGDDSHAHLRPAAARLDRQTSFNKPGGSPGPLPARRSGAAAPAPFTRRLP